MDWLLLASVAYAVSALISISDKYFLEHRFQGVVSYAFWVAVLGFVFLLAIPFTDFSVPSSRVLWAALGSGVCFTGSLILAFWAVHRGDVSRVVPTMGAAYPLASWLLASTMLGERLTERGAWAFAVLAVSGLMLSFGGRGEGNDAHLRRGASGAAVFWVAVLAGALGALAAVLAKVVYMNHEPFLSGLIWTRVFGGSVALAMLLVPSWRHRIFAAGSDPRKTGVGLLLLIRGAGGAAFIGLNYAVKLGSVTLVNALKGVEYGVVFVVSLLLSAFWPRVVKESLAWRVVAAKALGVAGICVGLWLAAGV